MKIFQLKDLFDMTSNVCIQCAWLKNAGENQPMFLPNMKALNY